MAGTVVWSERAIEQINGISEFIGRDSPAHAQKVVKRILDVGRQLEQFPFAGRKLPEAKESTLREVFVHSFRVICRPSADAVTVVAVIHGARGLKPDEL